MVRLTHPEVTACLSQLDGVLAGICNDGGYKWVQDSSPHRGLVRVSPSPGRRGGWAAQPPRVTEVGFYRSWNEAGTSMFSPLIRTQTVYVPAASRLETSRL